MFPNEKTNWREIAITLSSESAPKCGGWDNVVGDRPLPPYQEQFPVGSRVRVKPRSFLEQFQREWKYHHPISKDQIDAAGKTDSVKSVGFYHGGDVLYQLSEIPGTWHEECLESGHVESNRPQLS